MKQETYEITADSLQAARDQARARIPQGFYPLSEHVLSDGRPVTLTKTAKKSESAFSAARAKVPAGAHIVAEKEVHASEMVTLRLSAESEDSARKQAESKTDNTSVIQTVSLTIPGKKGFLGIGRTPNQYDIHILKKAVVEVTYKSDAKIVVTVGDQIANWSALLFVIKEIKDPMSATDLFSQFGYQILFALLKAKVDEPSYFEGIPFVSITKDIVEKARRYVDHPPVPGLLAMFGMDLPSDRYVIMSGGDIGRKSNPQIDALIVQVAGCLRGRGTFNMNDSVKVATFAYDAITHYTDIPAVYFFFALPYFESVAQTKTLSPNDALITVYKGVEGLLLEIYDELGEGQTITDDRVKNKVLQMLKP
ncbi:MAG: hypothetical protein WAX48_09180 [Desulfosalsimonadaceae bacterium]